MRMTAKQIASVLESNGFTVTNVTEPDVHEDGSVEVVNRAVYVQVGIGYVNVVVEKNGEFRFMDEVNSVAGLINDVKFALNETQGN